LSFLKQVNRLLITRRHDGVFRVRSPLRKVLKECPTYDEAFLWAHKNRKYAKKEPVWAEWELEFLLDNYGILPAEVIARRLRRSTNSLKIICVRKLGINQRSNIYTARAAAKELGISDAKIIVAWHDKGYLKGTRAPFKYGNNYVWFFDYDDIIECLQKRPWLCNLKRMPEGYFRSIVKTEWEKDRWYDKTEAGKFLGLADGNPIYRYIKKGWLPAVRRPRGGGLGAWILRHSALAEFQLSDPRPAHRKGATLPETLDHDLAKTEEKAWHQMARGHFQMFGYWAAMHQHIAAVTNRNHRNPFQRLIEIGKEAAIAQTKDNTSANNT